MLRTNMNEVEVETVNLRHEMRVGIDPRLDLAPVVFICPIVRKFLNRLELDALRIIRNRFSLWPSGFIDAAFQFDNFLLRNAYVEWANCRVAVLCHDLFPFLKSLFQKN